MLRKLTVLSFVTCLMIHLCGAITDWSPPSLISRSEILKTSEEVLAMPDIPVRVRDELPTGRRVDNTVLNMGGPVVRQRLFLRKGGLA